MEQRRHSNSTNLGEHARPSIKVSSVSRAKRSFLDSNQGLRVPIRDVHCAWVYREYDRGKSPHRGSAVENRGICDFALSVSPSLFFILSLYTRTSLVTCNYVRFLACKYCRAHSTYERHAIYMFYVNTRGALGVR